MWLGLSAAIVAVFGVVAIATASGGLFASTNVTFDAGNGAVNAGTGYTHDWNNPLQTIICPQVSATQTTTPQAGLNCGGDLIKSTSDNAFGQGSKNDSPCPTVVFGSIPPNKDDLLRFYVNSEKAVNGDDMLYLAWERSNVLGSAHMDFEFNHSQTACSSQTGAPPSRMAGDALISFDFGGSGNPDLSIDTWLTAAAGNTASQCLASSSLPCWGKHLDLTASGAAVGAVNSTTLSDTTPVCSANPITPSCVTTASTVSLPVGTFGEAGIDLEQAGVFSSTTCTNLGSAYLKSRSSGSSFTSELKDFIAPIPIHISNCGKLAVSKYIDSNENGKSDPASASNSTGDVTPLAGDLTGWSFTITGGPSPGINATCSTSSDGTIPSTCGGVDLTKLLPGTYTVTENANGGKTIGSSPGYAFFNTDPGNGSGGIADPGKTTVSKQAVVTIGGNASLTFGNSCYATAGFTVTGAPTDGSVSSMTVAYKVNGGTEQTTALTQESAAADTWTGSVSGLRMGDSISWKFYINGDSAHSVTGTAFSLPGYPACSASQSVPFGSTTITGFKYKDLPGTGVYDAGAGDKPLQGFTFQLKSGSTVLQTAHSASDGSFQFTQVDPGNYTIHEVPVTGWKQTQPTSGGNPTDASITIFLGESTYPSTIDFGNTPLSTITVTFNSSAKLLNADGTPSSTNATTPGTITCTDQQGTAATPQTLGDVGSSSTSNPLTTHNLELNQAPVTCTVGYTDP